MRRELGAARDALRAAREECASGECGVPASGVLPHLLCVGIWAVAFRLCVQSRIVNVDTGPSCPTSFPGSIL